MCQALPKEMWMDKRREDVLDAPYFHIVFTVPQELNPLIYCNQQLLYDTLYHSVSATINELTADTKHLGAKVGYICVSLFVKLDVSKTLYFCCYISSCFDRGYLDQTKLSMASGSDRRCASLTA